MFRIKGLTAGYEDQKVLSNLQLELPQGKITAIIGPNGSGKSTLLKCMAKQMPFSGEIFLGEQTIRHIPPKEFSRHVSYLQQSRNVPMITVKQLVQHGRFPYMDFPRRFTLADRKAAEAAMQRTGVWELRHKELGSLSGGERQKVYLAMVLAQDTEVLLLDEPATYLDIRHQLELLRLMVQLRNTGKTIAAVLHDINGALQAADFICVLNQGTVAFFGTVKQLMESAVIASVFGVQSAAIAYNDTYFLGFPLFRSGPEQEG